MGPQSTHRSHRPASAKEQPVEAMATAGSSATPPPRLVAAYRQVKGLFEHTSAGIALVSATAPYRVLAHNAAYCRLCSEPSRKQSVVGRTVPECAPPDQVGSLSDILEEVAQTGESRVIESLLCRGNAKDQTWCRWHLSPVYEGEQVVAVILISIEITDLKQAENQLRERSQALEERVAARKAQVQSLADALAMAEQHEQRRISQTLHDDLQQMLYSGLLRLQVIQEWFTKGDPGKAERLLPDLVGLLVQAVNLTRTLATELNPPAMESDRLEEGVAWLADHMAKAHGLVVEVNADEPCRVADPDLRALLLRTMRELLFNVVKHAGTDHACVALSQSDGMLMACIEDAGAGFDPQAALARQQETGGSGLFGIADRLKLIGGHLVIDSAPGNGTRIVLVVPAKVP